MKLPGKARKQLVHLALVMSGADDAEVPAVLGDYIWKKSDDRGAWQMSLAVCGDEVHWITAVALTGPDLISLLWD